MNDVALASSSEGHLLACLPACLLARAGHVRQTPLPTRAPDEPMAAAPNSPAQANRKTACVRTQSNSASEQTTSHGPRPPIPPRHPHEAPRTTNREREAPNSCPMEPDSLETKQRTKHGGPREAPMRGAGWDKEETPNWLVLSTRRSWLAAAAAAAGGWGLQERCALDAAAGRCTLPRGRACLCARGCRRGGVRARMKWDYCLPASPAC